VYGSFSPKLGFLFGVVDVSYRDGNAGAHGIKLNVHSDLCICLKFVPFAVGYMHMGLARRLRIDGIFRLQHPSGEITCGGLIPTRRASTIVAWTDASDGITCG
jgi:hypothetical protein